MFYYMALKKFTFSADTTILNIKLISYPYPLSLPLAIRHWH